MPFFGITLTSRVGSDLYYLLADPTGQEAGHILYDPSNEPSISTSRI